MSGAATPGYFTFNRDSEMNGNITFYEFQVKTTNYLVSGDEVRLELPYPVYFSEDTECFGRTSNLDNLLSCSVSVDLTKLRMTLSLPSNLGRRNLAEIDSGEEFRFRVTNIKNPPSFQPTTDSIEYAVYTEDGILIEELSEGFEITNTESGVLS